VSLLRNCGSAARSKLLDLSNKTLLCESPTASRRRFVCEFSGGQRMLMTTLNHNSRVHSRASLYGNIPAANPKMSESSSEIPVDDDYTGESDDESRRTLASTFRAYQYRYNRRFHEDQKGSQFLLPRISVAFTAHHLDQHIHSQMIRRAPTTNRSRTQFSLSCSTMNLTLHLSKHPQT
jgi:hypothetical protein